MNKEQLEAQIAGLTSQINEHASIQADLAKAKLLKEAELENLGKPKIPTKVMTKVYIAIEKAIDCFDFENIDNYETSFTLDWDERVRLEEIDFQDHGALTEYIYDSVSELFHQVNEEDEKYENTLCDNS